MNNHYALINGEAIPQSEASLFISDLSLQRGYGIFDFLKTIGNKALFLDDHLDRFYFSAAEMDLKLPYKKEQLKTLIFGLMKKNNLPGSGIRITLTGGYSENGYSISTPNLIITQAPFTYDPSGFKKGIKLVTYQHQRQLPHVKTIDYLFAIYLQRFIKEHHADEVLYHNGFEVTECPRANFFIVTGKNEIITPSKHILNGITRKNILKFPRLTIKEGTVSLKELVNAKEAFITSTTKYVLPVLEIDGCPVGDGQPGAMATQVNEMLLSLFKKEENAH